jgi:hypothetical protein
MKTNKRIDFIVFVLEVCGTKSSKLAMNKETVKLKLSSTYSVPRREDVWGSGGTTPLFYFMNMFSLKLPG